MTAASTTPRPSPIFHRRDHSSPTILAHALIPSARKRAARRAFPFHSATVLFLAISSADDETRQSEESLDARVDGAEESCTGQRAGERRDRVDLAFADVDEDRPRTHAAHRPADAEQHTANDVAAMLRLQLDRNRLAEH